MKNKLYVILGVLVLIIGSIFFAANKWSNEKSLYYPSSALYPHEASILATVIESKFAEIGKPTMSGRGSNTGSMRPFIGYNTILIIETDVTINQLNIGDIIVYSKDNGAFVSHQVIEIDGDKVNTMGVNNGLIDHLWVDKDNLVGRVAVVIFTKHAPVKER